MSGRKPALHDDLGALVDDILVDAYADDEPQVALLEVFDQEVRLPAPAWVQAAYLRWLGLKLCPYDMPPRWRPFWL